jgi:hypothetical protein
MKLKENLLFVDFHEWAWSQRTQGFPIYAVLNNGKAVQIGITVKKPKVYQIPEGTIAVVREYVSNSGLRTLFIYSIPSLQEFTIGDKNNWDVSELPENLQSVLGNMIQQHLAGDDP